MQTFCLAPLLGRWSLLTGLYLISNISYLTSYSQSGTWIWMNGSNSYTAGATYGTKGLPSANNTPAPLYQTAQWVDKQGNLWLFGGDTVNFTNFESDLWKYDPNAGTWCWVNGPGISNQPGVYGTLGVPGPNNRPGGRSWGSDAWVDTAGDLWLFSGYGYDTVGSVGGINDLWRYNIAGNEWTWMGGHSHYAQAGAYGTYQTPTPGALPPYRYEANTAWTDANNYLWLYGGEGSAGCLSDMWRYDIASNQWTWMAGGQTANMPGKYGTQGIESSTNFPPPRNAYTHWVDSNYLYFTGGSIFGGAISYSDVWRFNLSNYYFTWVGGDSGNVHYGTYSHYCSTNNGDEPRGRFELRTADANICGHTMFMFGGVLDAARDSSLNDLWTFDMRSRKWIWLSGYDSVNAHGNFGTPGVASPTNMPPSLNGHALWADNNGNLWLFGGMQSPVGAIKHSFNAMWKYIPDRTCFSADTGTGSLNYQLIPTSLCRGDSAMLNISGSSNISIAPINVVHWIDATHAWLKPDTSTSFTITGNSACGTFDTAMFNLPVIGETVNITANKTALCPGDTAQICAPTGFAAYQWNTGDTTPCIKTNINSSYYVTIGDTSHCQAISNSINVTVYQPQPVTISVNGDTLSGYNSVSYQWLLNGVIIPGATSSVYVAHTTGNYTLQITDANGCTVNSTPVLITGIDDELAENSVMVYPNPTVGSWQLTVDATLIGSIVEVFDATGRLVFQSAIKTQQSAINIPNAASGIYHLRISGQGYTAVRKLVKM